MKNYIIHGPIINAWGEYLMRWLNNEQGSVIVIVALMMVSLILLCGLVIDIGNLYVQRTNMQNAADAAAYGGGLQLSASQATASTAAKNLVTKNGFNANIATVTFTVDATNNPGSAPEINVTLTQAVPTYFLQLAGISSVNVSVLAEAVCSAGGPFGYALFSAGPTTLTLNYATYDGSVYSGGNVVFNGGGITLNGNLLAKGTISGYPGNSNTVTGTATASSTTTYAMPDYTSQISAAGTNYNAGGGTYAINGTVSGDIYVKNGNVTIGNTGTTTFANTEVIMCDGNITINSGNVTLSGSNQICIYSRTGNITFNGGGGNWNTGTVVAYAPAGTVYTGGGSTPFRSVVAQAISITGGSINVNSTTALSSLPTHVQLIK